MKKNNANKKGKATNEKRKGKKIKKNYIELIATERASLKQLAKRKFISVKAIKQILALLLFDKGRTMTEVMEELALSPQTLLKWRKDFKEKRMDSLLVFLEKKKDEDDGKGDDRDKNDELNPS
ncbi:MAG: helix-turn-helix domain-containing protein [Saprospiraceae bacterium]